MKKFRFQLETLLKVTKMNRDQAQVELAAAAKKLEEARQHLEGLLEEMAQGHKDYDALTSKGRITLGTLMTYNSFFNWKREQIEQQQRLIIECQAEKQRLAFLHKQIKCKQHQRKQRDAVCKLIYQIE